MMNRIWKQVLMLVVLTIPAAQAADIEVEPGDGTLAAAIAAASSGDTPSSFPRSAWECSGTAPRCDAAAS